MLKTVMVVLCAAITAGCAVGTNIKKHPAATSPAGVQGFVTLTNAKPEYKGELLSVGDDRVVMLVANRIIAVPLARIDRFYFQPFARGWGAPDAKELARLRSASRFPYGIPETALAALLGRSGQTAIEEVQ